MTGDSDYIKERDARRTANWKKLHTRMLTTLDVITSALIAAGAKVKKSKRERYETMREFPIDVVGVSRGVSIEAQIKTRDGYYNDGPSPDSPLVFRIGNYGGLRIRSAKDDPNLTGVRVSRIVDAVLADIENAKASREATIVRANNEDLSLKIAHRCEKLMKGTTMRAEYVSTHADRVRLVIEDMTVTEHEANEIAMVLVPILRKISKREEGTDE